MTGPSDDALSTILMDTVLDSADSVRLAREGAVSNSVCGFV